MVHSPHSFEWLSTASLAENEEVFFFWINLICIFLGLCTQISSHFVIQIRADLNKSRLQFLTWLGVTRLFLLLILNLAWVKYICLTATARYIFICYLANKKIKYSSATTLHVFWCEQSPTCLFVIVLGGWKALLFLLIFGAKCRNLLN